MAVDVDAPGRVAVLKALAEPVRWRIVERLAVEELCVCHLVDDLALAQPLVSHHLKVLRDAGIVEAERYRQWTYHRLVPDALGAVAGSITSLVTDSPAPGERRRPCC